MDAVFLNRVKERQFAFIAFHRQSRRMTSFPVSASLVFPVFLQGLVLSLGLIVAIGAQNAFVLRQGLRREHVASVVLFCALADAVLITAGVLGMAQALGQHPGVARAMALAGAAFLAWYGWQALQRARLFGPQASSHLRCESGAPPLDGSLPPEGADPARGGPAPDRLTHGAALTQAAAFTLLNPHVYLDTVLLVGSIGAQQPAGLRGWFIAGSSMASLGWFSALGFGARWLAPLFAKPRAWQVLDGLIGGTMWLLAALLLRHAMAPPGG
jgi:L-lysine exporter family protein LysE/ArgO